MSHALLTKPLEAPSLAEIARVDAWREEQKRAAEERARAMATRRSCGTHGPGPTGRVIQGPAVWGGGPTCKFCRRDWSRKHGGKRWESYEERVARERAEHAAMVAAVEAMPPAEFYAEWERLRATRHEATRRYHYEQKPDEFGVNMFGCATPDGQRYLAMRERVRREHAAFNGASSLAALAAAPDSERTEEGT